MRIAVVFAFVFSVTTAGSRGAGDFPTEWSGTIGSQRILLYFDHAGDDGKADFTIRKVSKDHFLCDHQDELYGGKAQLAKDNALRIKAEHSEAKKFDVILKPSIISDGGISFMQFAGTFSNDGHRIPLMIRAPAGQNDQDANNPYRTYSDALRSCLNFSGNSDGEHTLVDFLPGVLRILIRPALQQDFENELKTRGLQWKKVNRVRDPAAWQTLFDDPRDYDTPRNMYEVFGLREGDEARIGNELLKQKFALDVGRVERPKSSSGGNNNPNPANFEWVGTLDDQRVMFSGDGGGRLMPAYRCSYSSGWDSDKAGPTQVGSLPIYLHLEDMNTYQLLIGESPERYVEFHVKRQFTTERGIPIERVETADLRLNGKLSKLVLRRTLGPYTLMLDRCHEVGFVSEVLKVAVYPDADKEAREYFKRQGFSWVNEDGNLYILKVPAGSEIDELLEMRKQTWVADVWQQGAGAGLPPIPIRFPGRSIYRSFRTDQEPLRRKLRATLQELFDHYTIEDSSVAVTDEGGLNYAFSVEAPMELLGNPAFKGFWIKTKLLFSFSRTMDDDDESDIRDTMFGGGAPDAWLARWPSLTTPPPEGHYDLLGPSGSDRSKNLESLKWLQKKVVDGLRVKWAGVE